MLRQQAKDSAVALGQQQKALAVIPQVKKKETVH
jgi:hypothetical protein